MYIYKHIQPSEQDCTMWVTKKKKKEWKNYELKKIKYLVYIKLIKYL